jgi:hypothetical protein
MHAVTLYQPYPTLLACGAKQLFSHSLTAKPELGEEIAIHAAIRPVAAAYSTGYVDGYMRDPRMATFMLAALSGYPVAYGAVVAIARVREVVPTSGFDFSDHERPLGIDSRNDWVWIFESIRAIKPIEARGYQGLWTWEPPSELEYLSFAPVTFSPSTG